MAVATQDAVDQHHHLPADLATHFGADCVAQPTVDDIPTIWVPKGKVRDVMRYLKHDAPARFELMFDLSAIDERTRQFRENQPDADFTVFYHLMSLSGDDDLRVKVALADGESIDSTG